MQQLQAASCTCKGTLQQINPLCFLKQSNHLTRKTAGCTLNASLFWTAAGFRAGLCGSDSVWPRARHFGPHPQLFDRSWKGLSPAIAHHRGSIMLSRSPVWVPAARAFPSLLCQEIPRYISIPRQGIWWLLTLVIPQANQTQSASRCSLQLYSQLEGSWSTAIRVRWGRTSCSHLGEVPAQRLKASWPCKPQASLSHVSLSHVSLSQLPSIWIRVPSPLRLDQPCLRCLVETIHALHEVLNHAWTGRLTYLAMRILEKVCGIRMGCIMQQGWWSLSSEMPSLEEVGVSIHLKSPY